MNTPRTKQPVNDDSPRAKSEREFEQWLEEVDLEKLDLERLAGNPAVALDDDDDERVD